MTVQKFKTLADCIALAEFAHRNQIDKAGIEYIEHPRRVLKAVQAQGAMPYVQMAAILHDVTEDTAFTCKMLLDLGVPEAAVDIVRLVDRDVSAAAFDQKWKFSDTYAALMGKTVKSRDEANTMIAKAKIVARDEFYYAAIRNNPGALQVKLADIGDNMQPWRLSYLPIPTQDRLVDKYTKAIAALTK